MNLSLSLHAAFILKTLQAAGYEAYIVGGAVRDLMLAAKNNRAASLTTDYDFTTSARPEEIQQLFPEHFYENNFGTVSVTHEHLSEQMGFTIDATDVQAEKKSGSQPERLIDVAQATKLHVSLQNPDDKPAAEKTPLTSPTSLFPEYQITTFRSDEVYDDFRRPTSMRWGETLAEDLERRDFTINAMALKVELPVLERLLNDHSSATAELKPEEYEIIDPHQGQTDIDANTIRTVGNPVVRFQEDALRMLRALRFSVQLNMQIADQTFEAILKYSSLITYISWERIRDEFLKMLSSDFPAEAIELMDEAGLLHSILPELEATKGVAQGGHHTTDVWVHSLDALRTCPSADPIVRLATLLHDIAKPATQAHQNNTITFYNHEIIGSRMAVKIAQRLRLSKRDCERIFILVRYHMFHYQPYHTDAAIRRFMRNVGLENIDDILDLREADRLGSGARQTSWRLEEMKQRMIEQLHQPMAVTDLAINGHDLMTDLGMKPGPLIGKILHELFEKVLDNPELNTREALLKEAKALAKA
jgi:tRNA nucleotidyltransferase (CCA-adding enzyme)